jgi:hypothetical protein
MQKIILKILVGLTVLILTIHLLNTLTPKAGIFLIGTLLGLTITYLVPHEKYLTLEMFIKRIIDRIRSHS